MRSVVSDVFPHNWCKRFGGDYARRLRARQGRAGDTSHLDDTPRCIVTDKQGSYAAAKADVMPSVEHIRDMGTNTRAENSHQLTRERERRRRRFKSPGEAQWFLSTFSVINNHFRPGLHLLKKVHYREVMGRRFADWRDICALEAA